MMTGKVDKRFLTRLVEEMDGVCKRRWNVERPMVLVMHVLAQKRKVHHAKDIQKRILQCLNLWRDGTVDLILEDTEREAWSGRPGWAQSDKNEAHA